MLDIERVLRQERLLRALTGLNQKAFEALMPIEVDLGFQGLQNQYENIHLPHKKPRGGALSEVQKQENRCLSQSRVICENAFAGVKRYNAVSVVYRNRIVDFDDHLMLTAAGLWNFYLVAA